MSISAMKCALQSLESVEKVNGWNKDSVVGRHCTQSAHFLRQAIAEAEKQPVHASDISQERVDETAKSEHEPVAWREVAGKTTYYYDYNEDGRGEPLYAAPVAQCTYPKCQATNGCAGACSKEPVAWHEPGAYGNVTIHKDWALANEWEPLYTAPREWVGLDDDIPGLGLVTEEFYNGMLCAEDILRKRNT
jgi:hypothetical protein